MSNIADKLIEGVIKTQNPTCVGLDTDFSYLPDEMTKKCQNMSDIVSAIEEFNAGLIEAIKDIVPAVKVQVAYYEALGVEGMRAFYNTLVMAKKAGLIVIADAKRNDIGSTALQYAKAFLGETDVGGKKIKAFPSDFLTVNGYLGIDGIEPFLSEAKKHDRGIFILAKTSNPSSGQLQDREFADGETLYLKMGSLINQWGKDFIGEYGYSSVGAVVGATHPKQALQLRKELKGTLFLIPGYGAQGGTSKDLSVCFDKNGRGGIVNNSRGILCAYRNEKFKGLDYKKAARLAAIEMQKDLISAIGVIK